MNEADKKESDSYWRAREMYAEAREEGNVQREILAICGLARHGLYRDFGITDLTIIEALRLRKIVEELLPKDKQTRESAERGECSTANIFRVDQDAQYQWLYELYGIHFLDTRKWQRSLVLDATTEETFEFKSGDHEELASAKADELEAMSHLVITEKVYLSEFQEYIRRVRDQAHLP